MEYTFTREEIENIWAENNESLIFLDRFKELIHIGFKGDKKLSRWVKLNSFEFLKQLGLSGRLRSIYYSSEKEEVMIEILD